MNFRWKTHEDHFMAHEYCQMKFHGVIFSPEFSMNLGNIFHDPWISSKSIFMTHWFAMKVTRINFMTHEFLYKPTFMTHEFLQSLLSWPISFPRKSLEWISCPWIAIKQHFICFGRTKLMPWIFPEICCPWISLMVITLLFLVTLMWDSGVIW